MEQRGRNLGPHRIHNHFSDMGTGIPGMSIDLLYWNKAEGVGGMVDRFVEVDREIGSADMERFEEDGNRKIGSR